MVAGADAYIGRRIGTVVYRRRGLLDAVPPDHVVCGAEVRKALSERQHSCPKCGLSAGRDHVSAQVILSRAGNRPSGANVDAGHALSEKQRLAVPSRV